MIRAQGSLNVGDASNVAGWGEMTGGGGWDGGYNLMALAPQGLEWGE